MSHGNRSTIVEGAYGGAIIAFVSNERPDTVFFSVNEPWERDEEGYGNDGEAPSCAVMLNLEQLLELSRECIRLYTDLYFEQRKAQYKAQYDYRRSIAGASK